jgi:hypothetical protein
VLLEEISQDHAAQPFPANPEKDYLKCVAGEFMREYTPGGIESLPRLKKDVVRAQAYLDCQGEIESDADGSNKADEAFQRR